jgi:hypothetical protein
MKISEERNIIVNAIAAYDKFLLEHGYTDNDVWAEPPTAADTFLKEYFKSLNKDEKK